jgi:hypothetical protein
MVHALAEISRVLAPDGILLDIRPLAERWPVEVASIRESQAAGHVSDLAEELAADKAAEQAMQLAISKNWYTRERVENFPFFYYWDSPNEMQEYIEDEWEDFVNIDAGSWATIRAMWAVANADARLRVRIKMQITRLKKSIEI